jgi:hypothetical protein
MGAVLRGAFLWYHLSNPVKQVEEIGLEMGKLDLLLSQDGRCTLIKLSAREDQSKLSRSKGSVLNERQVTAVVHALVVWRKALTLIAEC